MHPIQKNQRLGEDIQRKEDRDSDAFQSSWQAQSLHSSPFRGPTAFMVGNERGGLQGNRAPIIPTWLKIVRFHFGVPFGRSIFGDGIGCEMKWTGSWNIS